MSSLKTVDLSFFLFPASSLILHSFAFRRVLFLLTLILGLPYLWTFTGVATYAGLLDPVTSLILSTLPWTGLSPAGCFVYEVLASLRAREIKNQ